MPLDIDFIRSQFPAFREPSLKGWSFFENAGGSYTCQQVIDRLLAFYTQTKVQPYYPYPASMEAGSKMDEAYTQLSAYLNVGEDELNFGPSTTQNVYVLANALRPMWADGDEIIVSCQDHEANAGAWRRLADRGIVVKEWHIDEKTGILNLDDLDSLISSQTKMIAFPHASNVVAHINPVREIADIAHLAGAIAVVDGVSFAPHGLPDITALGADIYLFSLYKTWGPHLGAMFVKRELMLNMANQSHYFNEGHARSCLTPAGPDHAQIAAAAGIASYLDAVYSHHFDEEVAPAEKGRRLHKLFSDYEKSLLVPLLDFLKSRDDLIIIGPDDAEIRAATVTILPKNKSVAQITAALGEQKLMVGSGNFYGVRPLTEMNVDLDTGVIRMSFVHYTTMAEIEHLIRGLTIALD
ncbi:MAG: aminotransferase class V-fold PLP-dependent enzyme [SAR86 cluster bacterium]|uniref:Aminotransferase class V-fold PLP-dependent enzyme n=1 Tax=SAR86 cluster bacterium TaxID=2030880 RepID=A0A972VTZ4_9GAMM|nr:aminotransferase class V-fold PLP-dependent enzyme [SAR86 cluster bacterium]